MQCLYEWQMTRAPLDDLLAGFWKSHDEPATVKDFCGRLVRGTVAHAERIDELIAAQADNWRIDRMGNVDRSILRLGVFELPYFLFEGGHRREFIGILRR